jgi:hypothetical protein
VFSVCPLTLRSCVLPRLVQSSESLAFTIACSCPPLCWTWKLSDKPESHKGLGPIAKKATEEPPFFPPPSRPPLPPSMSTTLSRLPRFATLAPAAAGLTSPITRVSLTIGWSASESQELRRSLEWAEEGSRRHDDARLQAARHHHPVRRARRARRHRHRPLHAAPSAPPTRTRSSPPSTAGTKF